MRTLWGASVILLASLVVITGCVSDGADSSSVTTEPRPEPAVETNTEEEEEQQQEQASVNRLPDSYEVVGVTKVGASPDNGKIPVRRVTAVGPTDADPRLIEYTLYEFADEASARAAAATAPDAVPLVEPIPLDRGGTLGFIEPTGPSTDGLRAQLGLIPYGPGLDAFFQVLVTPTMLAVGGSAVVQPPDLAPLLESLSPEPETSEQGLPDGMVIQVDEAPLQGTAFELRSTHGAITVELYPEVSRSWFEYFTWGTATDAADRELTDLGTNIRVRSPRYYGLGGTAIDPAETMVWDEERLTIVTHPDNTPSTELAELLVFFLELDQEEVLNLADSVESDTSGNDDGQEDDPPPPRSESVSDTPNVDDMARLQAYVETARGIDAEQPIVFEFIDDFPVSEARGFQFLSDDLWQVAVALGLTEDGQTLEGANQARIDRIKGTPGIVELQATRTFTDVVVVHEMVHVIDPRPQVVAEPELVSLGQAVAEGNAHRIAFDYLTALPEDEQAAVLDFPAIFAPGGDPRISTAVQDLLEFPYDEGRIFMAEIADRGGEALIESVLRRPPISTEQLLYVDAWVAEDAPVPVERPTVPSGAEPLSSGTLGVYLLLLSIREAGLGQEAMGVLDQWAGDSFFTYEDDSRTCVAAQILMDTDEAAAELQDLLDQAGSLRSAAEASAVNTAFCS